MNDNLAKFTSEFVFTAVVAAVVSLVVALSFTWVMSNMNMAVDSSPYVYFGSGIIFGLMIGYRLNTLVNVKPSKKKK